MSRSIRNSTPTSSGFRYLTKVFFCFLFVSQLFQLWYAHYVSLRQFHKGGLRPNLPRVDVLHSSTPQLEPDETDCTKVLKRFRKDQIETAKERGDMNYKRLFATVTKTVKPFYVATHDKKIDAVRAGIMDDQWYYETGLTERVAEIFDEKSRLGGESIMLDVGANIGWFSLVAAAHGATKVYAFEPNMQNTVRFCESLSLNGWLHNFRGKDNLIPTIIPITKGAGNETSHKKLYAVDERNPGSFSFKDGGKVIDELEITTLDSFAERRGWFEDKPTIALFKLDVEGFEPQVFEGANRLIKSNIIEKIAIELKPEQDENEKSKILQLLFRAGYELFMHGTWMGPNTKVEKVYDDWKHLAIDINNHTYGENLMFRLQTTK